MAALGAVGLGACAVLAACSPVQMGAAAIVGNQRITVSSLDTQVSNLAGERQAVRHAAISGAAPDRAIDRPAAAAVLYWQIKFAIMDQVAAANGISVTQAQWQAALSKCGRGRERRQRRTCT